MFPVWLGVDYGRRPQSVLNHFWVYLTAALPVALAFLLWLGRKRATLLVAAAMVFTAAVLPVLGLVPFDFQDVSTVSDHYLYTAMLGPAIAVAWAASRFPKPGVIATIATALAILATISIVQMSYWQNDERMWSRAIAVNPRSWLACNNLGNYLDRVGQKDRAAEMFRHAILLKPDYAQPRDMLGAYAMARGDYEKAVEAFAEVIRLNEKHPTMDLRPTYKDLGRALLELHRNREAAQTFREYLKRWPDAEVEQLLKKAEQTA
jgi:tetratricopeptide (TPR) repeat protein